MSYFGLVDIGLNVDTSGLEQTLDELKAAVSESAISEMVRNALEDQGDGDYVVNEDFNKLSERVTELDSSVSTRLVALEAGQDIDEMVEGAIRDAGFPTEDRVQEMLAEKVEQYVDDHVDETVNERIEGYLSVNNYPDESRVEEMIGEADLSDVVSNELDNVLEQRIDDDLNQRDLVTEDTVDEKIQEALSDYTTASDVRDIISEEAETVDEDALENRIWERITSTDNDEWRKLDQRVSTMAQTQDQRIAALEAKLDALSAEATEAMTLMDLLRHAYRIITGGRA